MRPIATFLPVIHSLISSSRSARVCGPLRFRPFMTVTCAEPSATIRSRTLTPASSFSTARYSSSARRMPRIDTTSSFAPALSSASAARSRAARNSRLTLTYDASSLSSTRMPSIGTSAGSPIGISRTYGSMPSGPAMTRSIGIRSSARRVIGPIVSIIAATSVSTVGNCPVLGTSPGVGFRPKTPLKNAGMRIEPPMSAPSPSGEPPEPTTAPSPPDDPPAVRRGS